VLRSSGAFADSDANTNADADTHSDTNAGNRVAE
jgi:hypothetical protein